MPNNKNKMILPPLAVKSVRIFLQKNHQKIWSNFKKLFIFSTFTTWTLQCCNFVSYPFFCLLLKNSGNVWRGREKDVYLQKKN